MRIPCLPPAFVLVSCLAYSSTMKMEVTRTSEISFDFPRATQCYIPEDRSFHNRRCGNLNSCSLRALDTADAPIWNSHPDARPFLEKRHIPQNLKYWKRSPSRSTDSIGGPVTTLLVPWAVLYARISWSVFSQFQTVTQHISDTQTCKYWLIRCLFNDVISTSDQIVRWKVERVAGEAGPGAEAVRNEDKST
jgi:hypothetical protein